MSSDRLSKLREFVQMNPNDCFSRYGVAQELLQLGQLEEAIGEFEKIIDINSDYQAAYFHCGKAYEKLGKTAEARAMYHKGIEASHRTADLHARGELEEALEELEGS